jgi:hypothetical protein
MIIAQQVQCSVQRKLTKFANLSMTEGLGVMPGAVEGNDDLTEKPPPRWQLVTVRK